MVAKQNTGVYTKRNLASKIKGERKEKKKSKSERYGWVTQTKGDYHL